MRAVRVILFVTMFVAGMFVGWWLGHKEDPAPTPGSAPAVLRDP